MNFLLLVAYDDIKTRHIFIPTSAGNEEKVLEMIPSQTR